MSFPIQRDSFPYERGKLCCYNSGAGHAFYLSISYFLKTLNIASKHLCHSVYVFNDSTTSSFKGNVLFGARQNYVDANLVNDE